MKPVSTTPFFRWANGCFRKKQWRRIGFAFLIARGVTEKTARMNKNDK